MEHRKGLNGVRAWSAWWAGGRRGRGKEKDLESMTKNNRRRTLWVYMYIYIYIHIDILSTNIKWLFPWWPVWIATTFSAQVHVIPWVELLVGSKNMPNSEVQGSARRFAAVDLRKSNGFLKGDLGNTRSWWVIYGIYGIHGIYAIRFYYPEKKI